MEKIELLEHLVRMQNIITIHAQTIDTMTKTLDLACRRIVKLEACMERASGVIDQQIEVIEELEKRTRPLGNNTLPKNKTRGRVIPLSLVARKAAQELADE